MAVGILGSLLSINISDQMLTKANKLLVDVGLTKCAESTRGDAEQLPYESNGVDGIVFSFTLESFDTPEIPKVLAECKRVLRTGGRIVAVAVSQEGGHGVMLSLYEWTYKHFPNLMDCRPILCSPSAGVGRFHEQWRRSAEYVGSRRDRALRERMKQIQYPPSKSCLGIKQR